jgi:hypothetical protein
LNISITVSGLCNGSQSTADAAIQVKDATGRTLINEAIWDDTMGALSFTSTNVQMPVTCIASNAYAGGCGPYSNSTTKSGPCGSTMTFDVIVIGSGSCC